MRKERRREREETVREARHCWQSRTEPPVVFRVEGSTLEDLCCGTGGGAQRAGSSAVLCSSPHTHLKFQEFWKENIGPANKTERKKALKYK